jgi:hypothetical protein
MMGIDFTAILDHQLNWQELYALPERLNKYWNLPNQLQSWVSEHVRSESTHWEWELNVKYSNAAEELFEVGYLYLDGPHGFWARVFKQAIEITHLARWWSFLDEDDVQNGLRTAIKMIAKIARSEHILYLPDSSFPPSLASDILYEGGNINDMLTWLKSEVGPPFSDPQVFIKKGTNDWDERGWFMERAQQ